MIKSVLTICVVLSSLLAGAQKKQVVFVCEHGAAKSVIATAYFNKMAKERNLNYEAVCRGTFPDSTISVATKEGLTKDKVLEDNIRPKKLLINDTLNTERIILFTKLPTDFNSSIKTEDWSSVKNIDSDYSNRRDAIIQKINSLLDTLEKDN